MSINICEIYEYLDKLIELTIEVLRNVKELREKYGNVISLLDEKFNMLIDVLPPKHVGRIYKTVLRLDNILDKVCITRLLLLNGKEINELIRELEELSRKVKEYIKEYNIHSRAR